MGQAYFRFKQFTVFHDQCAMKVTTDGCLFGAWCAEDLKVKKATNGLDVGAGSGLLSLQVAQKNDLLIDAIEIDGEAAGQAQTNIGLSPFNRNIRVIHAGAADYPYTKDYDFIMSNPPFYEKELQSSSAVRNLAHHSGLSLKALVDIIKKHLSRSGQFYLLLPYKRQFEAEGLLAENGLYLHEKQIISPSPLHKPQRLMLKGGFVKGELHERSMHIKNEEGIYSSEFVSLLEDYYLYL